MGALLFLAFAYFALGQAAANRNDAQGAADAAALAAANEARDQIGQDLIADIEELDDWEDLLAGLLFPTAPSCESAQQFAAKNSANSENCQRLGLPQTGFAVEVRTQKSVGSSIIPGTENTRSLASASATIVPLCALKSEPDEGDVIELDCKDGDLEIDPEGPEPLPKLDRLFDVRLVD